jgi:hypothetical protein
MRPWCLEDRLDWKSEREWFRPSPLPFRQSVDQTGERDSDPRRKLARDTSGAQAK